jgi:outer membrane protein OmpA-like peptidoglycan-associated protein
VCLGIPAGAWANVLGTDAQNFVPTTDGIDFVTVHSSETLRPGYLNFGFFLNYATNTLPNFGGVNSSYSNSLLSSDLNFGVGILKNWDFGVSVPDVLHQSITTDTGESVAFTSNGVTEIRINTKYRIYNDNTQGFATVLSTNIGLIENDPYTGSNAKPTLNLELVYDHKFGPLATAVNFGHRWRDPGAPIPGIPILPLRNQWIASIAGSYLVESWDTKLILEVFGAAPVSKVNDVDDRQQTVLEALFGAKHDFTNDLAGQFGFGRKLINGIASPDFRVYFGVNYALGALWGRESKGEIPTLEVAAVETATSEAPAEPEDHFVTRDLHFKFNSAELENTDLQVFDLLVAALNKSHFSKLVVEGHTDSIGNAAYNQTLSELRAEAIRQLLIRQYKIPARKITAVGYGKSRPIASNGNFQGRQLNRRVEFKIIR